MAVQFLSRAILGLPPVGTLHDQRRITRGYPYPRPHKYFTRINTHHTVTVLRDWDHDGILHGDIEDIARFMRNLMTAREADLGPEVPYSFVVFETPDPNNAIIAEGRGFERVGAHTQGENSSSYGVAFGGNTTIRPITKGMIEAVNWVGSKCYDPRTMRKTLGHRDHKATNCPGDSAYTHLPSMQPPFIVFQVTVSGSMDKFKERIMTLPVLTEGAGVGERENQRHHVGIMQSLMGWHGAVPVNSVGRPEGRFDHTTYESLKAWQARTGILQPTGTCDGPTWAWLMGVNW